MQKLELVSNTQQVRIYTTLAVYTKRRSVLVNPLGPRPQPGATYLIAHALAQRASVAPRCQLRAQSRYHTSAPALARRDQPQALGLWDGPHAQPPAPLWPTALCAAARTQARYPLACGYWPGNPVALNTHSTTCWHFTSICSPRAST